MFDSVDFEHGFVSIEDAGQSVLTNTKFGERATGQRLEEVVGVPPLGEDYLVEFGDDPVLDVPVEPLELIGGAR